METVINFLKLSPIIALALLTGCRSGVLPDPNDPDPKQLVSGEILLRNIGEMMQTLEERVGQGEINAKQREKIVEREVGKMLKNVDVAKVPPKQAWQFGDAFRLAGNWDTALKLYGGYGLTPNFAVESGYSRIGKFKSTAGDLRGTLPRT